MKLTSYSDFALRWLQRSALKSPELIRFYDPGCPHVLKIVLELGVGGYLSLQSGRDGGIRLEETVPATVIDDVTHLTEGPLVPVERFNAERNSCPYMGRQKLSGTLQYAIQSFMVALEELTHADIALNWGICWCRLRLPKKALSRR